MSEIRVGAAEERPFYTPITLAERLSVHRKTVRRLLETGEIASYRIGRAVRIDPNDVDSYLARRRTDRKAA